MRKSKYSICLLLSAALCAGMFYGCSHGGATSSDGDSGGGETSEQQALVGKYSHCMDATLYDKNHAHGSGA